MVINHVSDSSWDDPPSSNLSDDITLRMLPSTGGSTVAVGGFLHRKNGPYLSIPYIDYSRVLCDIRNKFSWSHF